MNEALKKFCWLVVIIILVLYVISLGGCSRVEVLPTKCQLPAHTKPQPLDINASNAEFLIYLRNLLQEYELLLKDYEACRE